MRFRSFAVFAGLLVISLGLEGCSLEKAMASCATCGEIRSITPRAVRSDIRLPTLDEAYAVSDVAAGKGGAPIVYHVRVKMDRGGSRDFIVPNTPDLKIGDRVDVRAGLLVRATPGLRWS